VNTPGVMIGERHVGPASPCFIIAEVGVNHNGDPAMAEACVRAAAAAGADAVKFQTFRAGRLVAPGAPKAAYQQATTGAEGDQLSMLDELELSPAAHQRLQRVCADEGVLFLSTPFDAESLQLLLNLEVPALKFGSGDLDNFLLMGAAKASGLPLLVSTGMSTAAEVAETVAFLREDAAAEFVLFQCVSAYPAPAAAQNLRTMPAMAQLFGCAVGFSDHTDGIGAAVAAVTLGACALEKHFTLDRLLPGPDHGASLEPDDFLRMVRAVRDAEASLGGSVKSVHEVERDIRSVARRSVVAGRDIAEGETLQLSDLDMKRPAGGLSGRDLRVLAGRRTVRALAAGEPLRWVDLR